MKVGTHLTEAREPKLAQIHLELCSSRTIYISLFSTYNYFIYEHETIISTYFPSFNTNLPLMLMPMP